MTAPIVRRHWQWLLIAAVSFYLIWLLSPALVPFVAAAMIAYLGKPLVDGLERLKFPRIVAVSLVFLGMLFVVAGTLLLLVPLVERQIVRLIRSLPTYVVWVREVAIPWIQVHLDMDPGTFDVDSIVSALQSQVGSISGLIRVTLSKISQSGMGVAVWVTDLVLIPVVTFYFLRDWNSIIERIDRMLPRRQRPTVVRLVNESDQVLGAFVRGQLLVMVVLGAIYAVGLSLMGLSVGPLIGMIAGLLSFVPYLGFIIGLASALIAVAVQFGDWIHFLMLAIVFIVGQVMESYVLLPNLVGGRIGLHPVAVMFAVLAGGYLFGFVGILLALPMAAVIMVLLRYGYERYRHSDLYEDQSSSTTD